MWVPDNRTDDDAAPFDGARDELIYQSVGTRVFRRRLHGNRGHVICKQPLGQDASDRLRHETKILQRLAKVEGVPKLLASPLPGVMFLDNQEGASLAQRRQRLTPPALLDLAVELVRIVAAVHEQGVVHKDINPANILLSEPDGRPLLIDFDLATTFAEERPAFVHPQEIAGTLAYLAPEQTGRTGLSVDQRADLYALGATLFELACGRPPFADTDPLQLIHDHLARTPVAPIEIDVRLPPALSEIILRLLEKEPDRRYQTAAGLLHDLRQLRERLARGDTRPFPLAERDFPLRLAAPSQLVGRDEEIRLLSDAFLDAADGAARVVLVSGNAGVGKTALVNELRPLVTARRGWFTTGKFDQYRRDAHAGGLVQALRMLGRLLLAESDAQLPALRARILARLGANAGVIAANLPEFALLLGTEPEALGGDPAQAATRLTQAGIDLLCGIASPVQPLVVVLDDLQWAEPGSIAFIDALLNADARHLLLVAAYRDDEVGATHPLSAILPRWRQLAAPLALPLSNLPPQDLGLLIGQMLRLPPEGVTRLAAAIGARTGGNPYDSVELVNALRREGVLRPGEQGWQWDEKAIRQHVGQGEVIDIVTARIRRLPTATQRLLEVMACLGNDARLALLQDALGIAPLELEERLAPALEDGLLVMEESGVVNADSVVRFRHDRVQQAAFGSISPEARTGLQLEIGRRLAAHGGRGAEAAQQYLAAANELKNPAEQRAVINLLRRAASDAHAITDNTMAERYLSAARALAATLPGGLEDSLALETQHHLLLYSLGRLEEADEVYRCIVRHSTEPLSLVDAACVQIASLTGRAPHDALSLGFAILRRLGLATPPEDGAAAEVEQRMPAFYEWIRQGIPAEDPRRPEASDPRIVGAARLMSNMTAPANYCDMHILAWLVLESQRLWSAHGPQPALALNLAAAPFMTIATSGDYRAAYVVTRYALDTAEQRAWMAAVPQLRFTVGAISACWFDALEDCVPEVQRAREELLQQGNVQMACLSHYVQPTMLLDCGATLDVFATEVGAALAIALRTGNAHAEELARAYQETLQTLRGETPPGARWQPASAMAAVIAHINRALCAALFDDAAELMAQSAAAMQLLGHVQTQYQSVQAQLLRALALTRALRAAGTREGAGLLRELAACRDWLAARAQDAPVNFKHLVLWIDAERTWAMGELQEAVRAFDTALVEATHHARPWHRALTTERAALCHFAHGLEHTGQVLLTEAYGLYAAWGALAKTRQLERSHGFLRKEAALSPHGSRRSSGMTRDGLDLLGVLRASQMLSSETSLEQLRTRVIELVGTMTGATSVTLILHDAGAGWFLARDDGRCAVQEAGARDLLPMSVFRYAERTREALLLEDATADNRFAHDPYFAGLSHCSLLAVPILSQGVLRAVLLLENRLARSAFSADRLDAVMLIAGQLAVSLDNALLYASLEQKVAERTEELKAANLRLEALSITDPLTGLANRRRFNEALEAEWQRARRPAAPLGLIMIDIDFFKLYNDHYGHLGGDEALRRVAAALATSVRSEVDLAARYGGEEFAIILPGTDLAGVRHVAERARAAVEALQAPHAKSPKGIVTISVGIAVMRPAEQRSAEELVQRADAALYHAKRLGRNRVSDDAQ